MKRFIILIVISIIIYTGCGGSGGSGGADPQNPTNQGQNGLKTGIFSLYGGINYKTDSQTGITSDIGEYSYKEGETVTFYINEYNPVGDSITAKSIILAEDLFGSSETAENFRKAMEALDEDANNINGIKISETIRTKLTKPLDFELLTDKFITVYATYIYKLSEETGNGTGNIGQTFDHFKKTLAKGVAFYLPFEGEINFQSFDTSVAYILKYPKIAEGVFIVGLNEGSAFVDIIHDEYRDRFEITVKAAGSVTISKGVIVEDPNNTPEYTYDKTYSEYSPLISGLATVYQIISTAIFLPEEEGI